MTERKTLRGKAELPPTLPSDPAAEKFGTVYGTHMRVQGGSITLKQVVDGFGNILPITRRTTTVRGQSSGFFLPETERGMTWRELVAAWPAFYEKQP